MSNIYYEQVNFAERLAVPRARDTYGLGAEFLAQLAVKFTDRIAFKPRENSDLVALTQVVFQTAFAQLGLRLSYERVYCASRV